MRRLDVDDGSTLQNVNKVFCVVCKCRRKQSFCDSPWMAHAQTLATPRPPVDPPSIRLSVMPCSSWCSAVGTERMGAFLLTYFTHSQHVAPPSSADMGYGFGQGGG